MSRGAKEDRISGLPKNVVDSILERLPIQDAVRTCVLSKSWRYICHMLPSLLLRGRFSRTETFNGFFGEIVDEILLSRRKKIVKFELDIGPAEPPSGADDEDEIASEAGDGDEIASEAGDGDEVASEAGDGYQIASFSAIDRWVSFVTRKGVKELTLSIPVANGKSYLLPPCIFNCQTLTCLKLTDCLFKPPTYFLGFQNLITLHLNGTIFDPMLEFCTIKAPHLANLYINSHHGTQYLKIVSPGLKSLDMSACQYYPLLNCFMNCKELRVVKLKALFFNYETIRNHISLVENFLASLPALEQLFLTTYFMELLSAVVGPNGLPFTFNGLWRLYLFIDFDKLDQISYALRLTMCAPNLSNLVIFNSGSRLTEDDEAVLKYLDAPTCLERPLDKLEHVSLRYNRGSKTELSFVKLLFSHAPSLLKMSILMEDRDIDNTRHMNILMEVSRFPRASPSAELVYTTEFFNRPEDL